MIDAGACCCCDGDCCDCCCCCCWGLGWNWGGMKGFDCSPGRRCGCSRVLDRSRRSGRVGVLRRDAERPFNVEGLVLLGPSDDRGRPPLMGPTLLGTPTLLPAESGARSASGGGVGGKTVRLSGGSDCCRTALLRRSGLTRFEAAKEIFSMGRSSGGSGGLGVAFLTSEPVKPVKALLRSLAATRRAFPR